MGETDTGAETKRDRVRRLLLNPLGFRFARGIDGEAQRQFLDRLADDLGYMADKSLEALCDMLRGKGQGSARNFWPDHATFIGFAELAEPRPLDELPALLSWFGSIEGPRAEAEGTLVETWEFVTRRKVPPVAPAARAMVAEKAAENARRLMIIGERRDLDMSVGADDLAWERWYLSRRDACRKIMEQERAARGKAGAA